MKLGATLYVKDSYEAVERYKEAFGLELGYHLSYEDIDGLKAWGYNMGEDYKPYKGYFHAELIRDGNEVFAVSGEGDEKLVSGHNVQLGLNLGSEEAVKRAVSVLSDGKVTAAPCSYNPCVADVVDKYGVWWFISV